MYENREIAAMEQTVAGTVANQIAYILEEPRSEMVTLVVVYVGIEQAVGLMKQTLEILSTGGMLTKDQSRKRTAGGTYFQLAEELIGRGPFREIRKDAARYRRAKRREVVMA